MRFSARPAGAVRIALIEPDEDEAAWVEAVLESVAIRTEVKRVNWPTPYAPTAIGDAGLILIGIEQLDAPQREALNLLHARFPRIPVVVLAGPDAFSWGGQALRLGALHLLLKSRLTAEALSSTIRHCAFDPA